MAYFLSMVIRCGYSGGGMLVSNNEENSQIDLGHTGQRQSKALSTFSELGYN